MQALVDRILSRLLRHVVDAQPALLLGGQRARAAVREVVGFFVEAREAAGGARVGGGDEGSGAGGADGGGGGGGEGRVGVSREEEEGFLEDFFMEDGRCGLGGVGAGEEGVGDVGGRVVIGWCGHGGGFGGWTRLVGLSLRWGKWRVEVGWSGRIFWEWGGPVRNYDSSDNALFYTHCGSYTHTR